MIMNICISHMEDADGIVSASLISELFDTKTILVDYNTFIPTLKQLRVEDLKELYISDLGIGKALQKEFLDLIKSMKNKGIKITYIDHHDQSEELKQELRSTLTLLHDINECTAVLIYSKFQDRLNDKFKLLVGAASIVDDMDKKPIASTIVRSYDRQFIFYETVILSYAIYSSQKDIQFLLRLVDELKSKLPHEINGIMEAANIYAYQVSDVLRFIDNKAIINGKFGYIYINDPLDTGVTANMLLMRKGLDIALAYKEREEGYVLSLRGAEYYDKHLGRITSSIASEVGGAGGGHKLACGASIPKDKISTFIDKLKEMI